MTIVVVGLSIAHRGSSGPAGRDIGRSPAGVKRGLRHGLGRPTAAAAVESAAAGVTRGQAGKYEVSMVSTCSNSLRTVATYMSDTSGQITVAHCPS